MFDDLIFKGIFMKFYSFSRLTIIYIIFIAFLIPTKLFAASIPNGAKKLSKNNMFQTKDVNGKKFFCGKISKKFIPGKKVSGYFYSHQAEIKNLKADMKKTSNKKQKKKIKNKITKLKEFIAIRKDVCLNGKSLRFDFSGAVGVAISNNKKSNKVLAANNVSSNLKKVDSLGNLKDAVVSGQVGIRDYFIAPNNKLYVIFTEKVNIDDTSNKDCSNGKCCLLAEIDKESGMVKCIERTAIGIIQANPCDFPYGPCYLDPNDISGVNNSDIIQFDAFGAIYYLAEIGSKYVIRKHIGNSEPSEIISFPKSFSGNNVTIAQFLVINDGSILILGENIGPRGWSLRKISSSSKEVTTFPSPIIDKRLLKIFDDGYIYFSVSNSNLYRVPQNFNSLDEMQLWVSPDGNGQCEIDYSNLNENLSWFSPGDIGCFPNYISPMGKRIDIRPYGGWNEGWILVGTGHQCYPKCKVFNPSLKSIDMVIGVGENLIFRGFNSNNKEQIILYNTDTDKEQQLLEPGKFSPYSFIYIQESNTVMFDAYRYEDSEYVIGQINLDTHVVTATKAGNIERLENFQALN